MKKKNDSTATAKPDGDSKPSTDSTRSQPTHDANLGKSAPAETTGEVLVEVVKQAVFEVDTCYTQGQQFLTTAARAKALGKLVKLVDPPVEEPVSE